MKRRQFLSTAAIGAAGTAAASSFPKPALSQGLREWRMVTSWPQNFPGLGTGAARVADRITAMSDGRLTVRVYAAGELVPPLGTFDAVEQGNAECAHSAAYYYQGKSMATNFFTAVPYGLTVQEHNAWIRFGGGQELWDELYDGFGIKPFLVGNTTTQAAGWFRSELTSLDDLQGLRFRTAGLGGEVFRRIGANVQTLPGGEIFPALQAGTLDAAEWVGPWNDLAFGLYRIAPYLYYPSVTEPSAALEFAVNKAEWESLDDDLKAIVENATAAENDFTAAEFGVRNAEALRTLITEHEVQVNEFPAEIVQALADASRDVVAELRDVDDITRRVHDSYMGFREQMTDYAPRFEQGFLNTRSL